MTVHDWIKSWPRKPQGTSETAQNVDLRLAACHEDIGNIYAEFQRAQSEDALRLVIKRIEGIQTSLKVAKTVVGSLTNQSHIQ